VSPPRPRTAPDKINRHRELLLHRLQAAELARDLIEAYITPENIECLEDDPIVARLRRIIGYFDSEVQQIEGEAVRRGWKPQPTTGRIALAQRGL
jgi:hypothetical protein